ncbi:MAG TPA: DUF302 domain-containing protein [Solirubrobacteraceae bacterium]|jgi:uncharacterized protein (DUF302 family)
MALSSAGAMVLAAMDDLIERTAGHSVADTVDRLGAAAAERGMTVFARVDHAAGAREAGLELADEVVLLVGSPKAGTLLMQRDARVGLDLPLRILVWDDGGTTRIAYRPPAAAVPADERAGLEALLEQMAGGLAQLVDAAA